MKSSIKPEILKKPIPVKMTADDMRQLRLRCRMSQLELAWYLGITREAVNRYENGSLAITRQLELALRFRLISEMGEYHFAWQNPEKEEMRHAS